MHLLDRVEEKQRVRMRAAERIMSDYAKLVKGVCMEARDGEATCNHGRSPPSSAIVSLVSYLTSVCTTMKIPS